MPGCIEFSFSSAKNSYFGQSSALPGFTPAVHFACMLYEKLTGDGVDE